jgi:hypothetical protein
MNLGGITREQKLLGAAGANVVFIIAMFLDWFGEFGRNDLDGWWILLIIAAVSAAVFAADALNFELPPVAGIPAATYLTSLLFFDTFLALFEGSDHALGFWLALIASIVSTGLAWMVWKEDR